VTCLEHLLIQAERPARGLSSEGDLAQSGAVRSPGPCMADAQSSSLKMATMKRGVCKMRAIGRLLATAWLPFALTLGGCSFSPGAPPTPTSTPTIPAPPSVTPVPPTPTSTETPLPTATMAPTITPTSGPPMVSPQSRDIPCYFGPGTIYLVEGYLLKDRSVPALGKNADGNWLQINHSANPRWFCWVNLDDIVVTGDVSALKVVPPPIPFVESVLVNMKPKYSTTSCGNFPFSFKVEFSITVNGPTAITFQRSLSNGTKASPETFFAKKAGTYPWTDHYDVGTNGAYWFRVHVTSPNDMTGEASATMKCS
jgi:hypothetical protein